MEDKFEKVLDECIDRMSHGEKMRDCLDAYPEYAHELEPLLNTMVQTKTAFPFTPSDDRKRAARAGFYAALDKRRQLSLWERIKVGQPVWFGATAVLLIAIIAVVTYRTLFSPALISPEQPIPAGIPSFIVSVPNREGNFAFLVSDEENAIGDFTSLNVTIEKVVLLKSDGSDQLIEFEPEVKEFDLTLLPGDKTQELWRGQLPQGTYNKVFLDISSVKGVLKATGETIPVKLPSEKLQLARSFQIKENELTSFTFDITVIKTGQVNSGKYLLKPQAAESGVVQTPHPTPTKGKGKP